MDWTDDELEQLGLLSVRFSGISSSFDEIDVNINNYVSPYQTIDFCSSSLFEYSRPDLICSTSWATSIIEIANRLTGKSYSVNQLLNCLPLYEEIDKCSGVHPKSLVSYLMEIGLEEEENFIDCKSIDSRKTQHFTPIYPESPNAGGLMNLIAEGKPVFAMVALDLNKLRFVKEMNKEDNPLKCGSYEPSMYGIVNGYKYDEVMIEDNYW